MPDFRRYYIPNAVVFITAVTRDRFPHFDAEDNIALLFDTLRRVQAIHPFHLLAYAILSDHLHWLMRVDGATGNFSNVLHSIKRNYTLNYKKARDITAPLNIWQERFWDHVIRDDRDLHNHFDYIHWNPVKHGYVSKPEDWRHSTYCHWLERGYYEPGWGHAGEPDHIAGMNLE
jgi:putative transposase